MKTLTKYTSPILSLLIVLIGVICVYFITPKIGYVRSNDLVYGYEGMKVAQVRFEDRAKKLQENLDTLKVNFEKERLTFKNSYNSLSAAQKAEKVKLLENMEENIEIYSENIAKQIQEDDVKLTKEVLNQINGFIEEYASSHHFDLVLGSGGDGTVLFGAKKYDITDDLLKGLNKNHTISKSKVNENNLTE
ncbi:MAG: OmpH family outer membrane protein [Chitinophagaceae bacterium]|nr:OmpH family outer membrane protein [Chitinophagaceae bacterium]